MSNEDNIRPTLTVHEGGRKIGTPFESSAQLTPVPTLPNAKELRELTSNPVMQNMIEVFQQAHKNGFSALGILLDNNGKLQYAPVNNEDDLIEYAVKPKLTNVENLNPAGLELIFIFDLSEPFTDQFPIEHIKSVRDTDDILEAFIDTAEQDRHDNGGYGDLPKLIQEEPKPTPRPSIDDDWNASANPNSPYSEKIQRIHEMFDSARRTAMYSNFYVILTEDRKLVPLIFPEPYSIIDANNFLKKERPNNIIIMALDLSSDFDTQIRYGIFDPEQLEDWDILKITPLSCLKDIKSLPHEKITGLLLPPKRALHILGPRKPVLVFDNNPKPKP